MGAPIDEPSSRSGYLLASLRWIGRVFLHVPRAGGWLLAAVWMGFLWWLSSGPGRHPLEHFDLSVLWHNAAHAPAFGLVAYFLILAVPRRGDGWVRLDRRWWLVVLAIASLYGVVDELHQGTVPLRVASWTDWLTDTVGAACVLVMAEYLGRRDATERGLWLRFGSGLVVCMAAACLATFW